MKLGGASAAVQAAALAQGIDLEKEGLAAPPVWAASTPFWNAFHVLSRSRPMYVGMAGGFPGAISYTELSAYAKDHGYGHPDDLLEFVQIVGSLDTEYLNLQAEQRG